MSATELGLSGVTWGTIGDADIIVENIRESYDGEWDELGDGDGDIVAAVAHGTKGEVTMDFTLRGAAAGYLTTRGATITLPSGETDIAGSQTLYLVSWEKTKEKNGWMSGTLTANYYPDMS